MRFEALSRLMIQDKHRRFVPDSPHFILSISTPGAPAPTIPPHESCKAIEYFWFYDLNKPAIGNDGALMDRVFNEEDASRTVDFYLKARSESIEDFIAHCDGGASRSVGLVAALCKIDTGNDDRWFSCSTPNSLVYTTILNHYYITRGLK